MAKFKKLHAPKGTDEANVAGVSYRVDNDGTIDVPVEASGPLLALGGFTEDSDSEPVETAMVRAHSPKGTVSCSWGGDSYDADADGVFVVPAHALTDLSSHGIIPLPTEEQVVEAPSVPKLKIPK